MSDVLSWSQSNLIPKTTIDSGKWVSNTGSLWNMCYLDVCLTSLKKESHSPNPG
uniref:Uncharacterized protein n=1 Tax=Helianthus annuus TaxID=4232 RepID=A0A251T5K0_HELAN